jgi:hypothetical protein
MISTLSKVCGMNFVHVTNGENNELCKPFSKSEIKGALFLIEKKTRLLGLIKYLWNSINNVGI